MKGRSLCTDCIHAPVQLIAARPEDSVCHTPGIADISLNDAAAGPARINVFQETVQTALVMPHNNNSSATCKRRRAMLSPIPVAAPVTTATFSLKSDINFAPARLARLADKKLHQGRRKASLGLLVRTSRDTSAGRLRFGGDRRIQ
jgi:hypothetical protein